MSLELLSLGLDFVGGLMGHSSQKKDRALRRDQMRMAQSQFDAQMDQSVQRRVADAKKAGIHPLFALGASAGGSPTISAGNIPSSRNPMQAALTGMARSLGVIEQNRASARRDEAEAALLDSERKRIEQELAGPRGHDAQALQEIEVVPRMRGTEIGPAAYYSPEVAKSQRQGVAAGTHPGAIEYVDHRGYKWTVPATDLNMDEIGQVKYVLNAIASHGLGWRDAVGDAYWSLSNRAKRVIRNASRRMARGAPRSRRNNPDTDWIAP
jgi:hypothetical protein